MRFILLIWAILGLRWAVRFNYTAVRASVIGWPAIGDLPMIRRDILHPDRAISLTEDDVQWFVGHMESRYLELERAAGRTSPDEFRVGADDAKPSSGKGLA